MRRSRRVDRRRMAGALDGSLLLSLFFSPPPLPPATGPPTPSRRRLPIPPPPCLPAVAANLSFAIVSSRSRRARARAPASVFHRRFARAARKTSSAAHRARTLYSFLRPAAARARRRRRRPKTTVARTHVLYTERAGRVAVSGVAYVYARCVVVGVET